MALTIAGSDPSGGAGIQADLKTFHQFGVYGEAAITLLTVQNTTRVSRVEVLSAKLVVEQIRAVIEDIPPAAAKTGALGSVEIVEAVAELAATFRFPLVVDPVMISKHGARLISREAEEALKKKLLPHAFLVTPNIPEAEALTGMQMLTETDVFEATRRLRDFGCKAALIKTGHASGRPDDVLETREGFEFFVGNRVGTRHTHGTGCTHSAAITAGLARGDSLHEAIRRAKAYVEAGMASAPGFGGGYGPLNHFAEISS